MATAARRALPTASTTVRAPDTQSPAENTPSMLVIMVAVSTAIVCHFDAEMCSFRLVRSTSWPIASTMVSAGVKYSEPAMGSGRRRPLASGSPSRMRWLTMPTARPASMRTSTGALSRSSLTPSTSASWISCGAAGISARERRYIIVTSAAPKRRAVRTASAAEKPPPTTTTFWPSSTRSPRPTRARKSITDSTLGASSPGMPPGLAMLAPTLTKTAS